MKYPVPLVGEYISGFLFVSELEKRKKLRVGLFECPYCHNKFSTQLGNVVGGHTKSCGCKRSELISLKTTRHGFKAGGKTRREYNIWSRMIQRCINPNCKKYPDYGGRGIMVCDSWLKFENFIKDMGEIPDDKSSIDRFPDNNGNYNLTNCRWADSSQQNRNKRNTMVVTHNGEKKPLIEWCELLNINYNNVRTTKTRHKIPVQVAFDKYLN